MAEAHKEPSADDAINIAFDIFKRYVDRDGALKNILLEELEPLEGGWIVSIGFDGSRKETTEPAVTGSMAALTGFGNVKTTTVREVRHIHIGADGKFQKIG